MTSYEAPGHLGRTRPERSKDVMATEGRIPGTYVVSPVAAG